ncbi:MAG: hypothetical protein MZW92_06380 [Comamonadaceae bacterium]|nr:hypothetical protein [Comamonadaceae bacterium]
MGDSFAEFKAGGITVVCGVSPRNPDNILGYRPCVGMVGGVIYFRGPIRGYSERDVKLLDLTPQDWEWLKTNMKPYLTEIERLSFYKELDPDAEDWKKLMAYTPGKSEERTWFKISTSDFRKTEWEKDLGQGRHLRRTTSIHDQTLLPYITTGKERRNRPVWANDKYLPPCAFSCPSRIPSHTRTRSDPSGQAPGGP